MKVKCPNCGAESSLDLLIANEAAAEAVEAVFLVHGALGKALMQYLGLFRPKKSALTMNRVAKIIGEINKDIASQSIMRDGVRFDAPVESWLYAIDQMIKSRDAGKLKTPITSHGYLYEVIAGYKAPVRIERSIAKQIESGESFNRIAEALGV